MTTALGRSPLQAGRSYRDRKGRLWRVARVTNAGRDGASGAAMPSLAMAVCLEADAAGDVDTRHPQWLYADDGRWSPSYQTDIDLVVRA